MIFTRSIPPRLYRNYSRYRELLRRDFQYLCAYCLTHEYYLGGDANYAIDHYRPRKGTFARPDLENEYTNLYWSCRECNENKADNWPDSQEEAMGFGWINPCDPSGDHALHWTISPEGELRWLTRIGEYTAKILMLHQRDWLKHHWKQMYKWQQRRAALVEILGKKKIPQEEREEIEQRLQELNALLEAPVYNRPRKNH